MNTKAGALDRVWSGEDRSPRAALARAAMSAGEPGYRVAVILRNALFNSGLRRAVRLAAPVVSVGNITTGGTGKTPMVIALVQRLIARGRRPAVLLRGYGGTWDPDDPHQRSSDEADVLRHALGELAPVIAHPDRVHGARLAQQRKPDTDVFVLDDGFQHRRLVRDLDLVLIDATRPFGYGRLLPRGLLREPPCNLRRADAVIITRADQVHAEHLERIEQRIEALTGRRPLAHAAHRWHELREGDKVRPISDLRFLKVVGVCGVGNPQPFIDRLARAADTVLRCHSFRDHHAYTAGEVETLLALARRAGADAVVTTEKDWVKWQRVLGKRRVSLPVIRPIVAVEITQGDAELNALLDRALANSAH